MLYYFQNRGWRGMEMKCELCHKREADMIFTEACCKLGYKHKTWIVDGHRYSWQPDMYFCSECYEDQDDLDIIPLAHENRDNLVDGKECHNGNCPDTQNRMIINGEEESK